MAKSNQIKSGWFWQKKLKRAVEVLREEGITSFWFKVLSEIGYRRVLWLKRSLEEPIPEIKSPLPVTVGMLQKTEVDEYIKFHSELRPSCIVSWLDAGHRCFVARYKGQVISATWATTNRTSSSYLAREIHLRPGEVYLLYSFTNRDFRGLSVSPIIKVAMMRYFRDTGYRQMICWILPENNPSLNALQKVGFRPFSKMGYVKIGPWRWHFIKQLKVMIYSDLKLRWWTKLAWQLYEYLPLLVEDFIKRCFRYILPFKNLSIPIMILRGPTRFNCDPGTLLVAGSEDGVDYLTSRFFEDTPNRESVGNVPLWKLALTLNRLRTSVDLTIARLDRLSARLFLGADYLAVPEWVGSILTVPEDLANLTCANQSLKTDLRTVHRNGLTFEVTKAEEDFEDFYYNMYIPFIRKRHGIKAFIRNVYWMRRAFRKGGLIWVLQGNHRISGVLFRQRGRVLQSLAMGTANGEWEHVRAGGNIATDLFLIEHAKKLGCKLIDLGGSRPSLNDGVLRYKRKWAVNLVDKQDSYYDFLVYWDQLNTSVISFLSNTPLIFRQNSGLSAIKVVECYEQVTETEVEKIRHFLWIKGLHQLYLAATGGWKAVNFNPPKTVLIDLIRERTCNFSTPQAIVK